MNTPTDDQDRRNTLDPREKAEPRRLNGQWIVTAGREAVGPMSEDEAWRVALTHNGAFGHGPTAGRRKS